MFSHTLLRIPECQVHLQQVACPLDFTARHVRRQRSIAPTAGEYQVAIAHSVHLPPPEAEWVRPGRPPGGSGLSWQTAESGLYLVQNLGQNKSATQMPEGLAVTLYRVTAVGLEREARVVLESIFAWPELPGDVPARRIAWRQVF